MRNQEARIREEIESLRHLVPPQLEMEKAFCR